MYDQNPRIGVGRFQLVLAGALLLGWLGLAVSPLHAQEYSGDGFESTKIIRRISQHSERLELTTNSSRILTLDKQIPRVQVNNPEIVAVTPLSATQVQISAKKPGVTQVNLWDEDKQVHSIDVIIYGDLRELEFALRTQFPNSSVKVRKYSQSLMLTGFVDSPDHVVPIQQLAEDYAPKVITNMQVGGVQQVLLKVKIFEVSRTKLRALGSDFAARFGNFHISSSVSGLLNSVDLSGGGLAATGFGQTVQYGVLGNDVTFFGFLDALQQNNVAKILAEPNIVSVSGRPAQFLEGGELPILVPQSLGTSSIEFKPFGTQVDFLPVVLGNGNIRLEVRPRVSAVDPSIGIVLQNENIPGFRVRQADTAVEMRAGQTFALAGLIQHQTESIERGIPYLSDLPYIGVPFRKVEEKVNEIELLILVTPEFVDALDPHEVPQCGPGMGTVSPTNKELYLDGFLEVPNQCGPCATGNCQQGACDCHGGHPAAGHGGTYGPPIYEQGAPHDAMYHASPEQEYQPAPIHGDLRMPTIPNQPRPAVRSESGPLLDQGAGRHYPADANIRQAQRTQPGTGAPYAQQPNYRRQTTPSAPPAVTPTRRGTYPVEGNLIGPIGYDVEN